MKVVITGGHGFVGKNLFRHFCQRNFNLTSIDRKKSCFLNSYFIDLSEDLNLHSSSYDQIFPNTDFVFHLAAKTRIPPSSLEPEEYYKSNIVGTRNVVQLCNQYNVKNLIFFSSSSVYGGNGIDLDKETNNLNPLNYYAETKVSGEEIVKGFQGNVTIVRPFTIYGPGMNTEPTESVVIGNFLRQKHAGEKLTIDGTGSQKRDFIHIKDVLSFCEILVHRIQKDKVEIYNLGTGRNVSINHLASLFNHQAEYVPSKLGYSDGTLADISKAKSLGWTPKITLEQGIKELLEQYKLR